MRFGIDWRHRGPHQLAQALPTARTSSGSKHLLPVNYPRSPVLSDYGRALDEQDTNLQIGLEGLFTD